VKREIRAVAGKPRDADVNYDRYSLSSCLFLLILLVAVDMASRLEYVMNKFHETAWPQYLKVTDGQTDEWTEKRLAMAIRRSAYSIYRAEKN